MGVPEGAEYSEYLKQWGVGERDADGKSVGTWRWYDDEGTRVWERDHGDDGAARCDRHYYPGSDDLLCVMTYDDEGHGSPVVYIDPARDWRSKWSWWVNRPLHEVPSTARRVEKLAGVYPLTFRLFDGDGRPLCRVGLPEREETREIAELLSTKPARDAIGDHVARLNALFDALGEGAPEDVAKRLKRLRPPRDAAQTFAGKRYKSYRERVAEGFSLDL